MTEARSFGATSTVDEVLEGVDVTGRHVVVTGATSGLGEESARALAAAGARVTMLGRDPKRLLAAEARVRSAVPAAELRTGLVDLADLQAVQAFVDAWDGAPIDVLMNNAGVMACPFQRTVDGHERQFATNHLGHFLLTVGLLPALLAADAPRVVTLSSAGHSISDVDLDDPDFDRTPYDPFVAYGRSKTANILFTRELARRHPDRLLALAVHPGGVRTELGRHLPPPDPDAVDDGSLGMVKTLAQGAATQVWAATAPELVGHSGSYLADCQVGVVGGDIFTTGVRPHAFDADTARALWDLSERLVSVGARPPS